MTGLPTDKCEACAHLRSDHIYNEGACRPGFVCQSACEHFVSGNELTDDELLSGLWWGDPEFHPLANDIWRGYINDRAKWDRQKAEYAIMLRYMLKRAQERPFADTFEEKWAKE